MFEIFKVFKDLVENFSGKNINIIRTDNGKEYFNKNLQYILD